MKKIKTVSIIGLGALGVLFGHHLSKRMPKENLRIVADKGRIDRYRSEQVYCNDERCDFQYVTPEEQVVPADLLIFAVKNDGLADAIQACKNHVGEHTIILSALNGITSEAIIGDTYGMEKVLYCVAQGMDAVKVGNRLTYDHMGMFCIGERDSNEESTAKVKAVSEFFDGKEVPYQIIPEMYKHLWSKFMLNVGVNQTVAVYKGNYGEIQKLGEARETMIAAMREVMVLSGEEGIHLTEENIEYWLNVLSNLSPEGKPSMAQDLEAKRFSEVELFSGTVLALGRKHGISTPVNEKLYNRIKAIESEY